MRVAVNDTELYFDVEGAELVPDGPGLRQRPVMLLLHGGPGFDHAYFKPVMSALADTAQLVYLDLRGQGRSAPAPIETCTLEQMADDVAAFGRAVGLTRPVVLGHSAGGFVALHLVQRHPAAVGRLILVDTAAATADMGDAMAELERRRGAEARAVAERLFSGQITPAVGEAFNRLVLPAYAGDQTKFPELAATLGHTSFNAEIGSHYFANLAPHYDVRAGLGAITAPTLVIVGDADWLTPTAASRTIAAAVPGAELAVLPGAGHFPYLEQPAEFCAIVRRFLTTNPA